MTTPNTDTSLTRLSEDGEERTQPPASKLPNSPLKKSLSMHDNIPDWYDCCSCEAEPYWEEAMAESQTAPGEPQDKA